MTTLKYRIFEGRQDTLYSDHVLCDLCFPSSVSGFCLAAPDCPGLPFSYSRFSCSVLSSSSKSQPFRSLNFTLAQQWNGAQFLEGCVTLTLRLFYSLVMQSSRKLVRVVLSYDMRLFIAVRDALAIW